MELKHLKEMKRVYDLNIKDLDREELETLAEINYALQCAINGVGKQSELLADDKWDDSTNDIIFDGFDPNFRGEQTKG